MINKTMLAVMCIVCLCIGVSAQDNFIPVSRDYTFSANRTDYSALGIHPANLSLEGREGQRMSLGFFNMDFVAKSSILKSLYYHKQPKTYDEGVVISKDNFNLQDLGRDDLGVSANVNWLGFSIRTKKAGSFAFSVRTQFQFSTHINKEAKDILYQGDNFDRYIDTLMAIAAADYISGNFDQTKFLKVLDGTKMKGSMMHEVSLGYSRQVFKNESHALYAGAGLRIMLGQMDFGISFDEGTLTGYMTDLPFLPDTLDTDGINMPGKGGNSGLAKGGALDLGITYEWEQKMQISLSAVGLGATKWPVTPIYLKDVNTYEEALAIADEGVFYYGGKKHSREPLPSKLVMGYNYSPHKLVDLYLDVVAPLNNSPKNLERPLFAFGTQLSLFKIASFRTGATFTQGFNKQKINMPMYLSIFMGKGTTYEIGIGTQDILGYAKPEKEALSGSFGMMRFHF